MSIGKSIGDTIGLFKHSFVLMGENRAIFAPTLRELWIWVISTILIVVSVFLLFFSTTMLKGISFLVLIALLVFLYFIFPFVKMYYRAAQSWIVYKTFTGGKPTYKDGAHRAQGNKWDIFVLGLFDIIFTALAKRLQRGSGSGGFVGVIITMLMRLAGTLVKEGWDLIGHFLLPASIIPEKTVKEALPEIKNLKNNVPGALAGVFGIDFAGDAIRGFVNGFFFLILFLCLAGSIMLKMWFILAVGIIIVILANTLMKLFIEMIKTIYFTLFYLSISMPMEIPEDKREKITQYLLYKKPEPSSAPVKKNDISEKAKKMIPYIQQYRTQGKTDEEIRSMFKDKKWPEKIIKEAFDNA